MKEKGGEREMREISKKKGQKWPLAARVAQFPFFSWFMGKRHAERSRTRSHLEEDWKRRSVSAAQVRSCKNERGARDCTAHIWR